MNFCLEMYTSYYTFVFSLEINLSSQPHHPSTAVEKQWAENSYSRFLRLLFSISLLVNMSMIAFYTVRLLFSVKRIVEDIGFEPMTPCVQGRCSSQLS